MKDINFLFDLINKIESVDSSAIKEAQTELNRKMKQLFDIALRDFLLLYN